MLFVRAGRGGGRGKTEERLEGHEGERQIKFDRKLHEIVGEPRWSAPVRQPMPTRLFLATDYHRSSPRTRGPRNEGAPRPWPPRPTDPTTSHVPDARNAPFPSERIGPITLFGAKPHTRVSIEAECKNGRIKTIKGRDFSYLFLLITSVKRIEGGT